MLDKWVRLHRSVPCKTLFFNPWLFHNTFCPYILLFMMNVLYHQVFEANPWFFCWIGPCSFDGCIIIIKCLWTFIRCQRLPCESYFKRCVVWNVRDTWFIWGIYVGGLFAHLAGKEKIESFEWRNTKIEHQSHLETFIIKNTLFEPFSHSRILESNPSIHITLPRMKYVILSIGQ